MSASESPPVETPAAATGPRRALRWLRGLPIAAKLGIVLAVLVNLLLLAGYLWSRGGASTHIRVEATDQTITAYVDGRQQARSTFPIGLSGGVILSVEDASGLPSLPGVSGLDEVTVTDLKSGEVLYHDDFNTAPPASAIVPGITQGTLQVKDGVLQAHTPHASFGIVAFRIGGDAKWQNYAVDATYRNMTTGIIRVRASTDKNGVEYGLRPFRHLDNRLTLFTDGQGTDNRGFPSIEVSKTETLRSMVAMVLRPYPWLFLLLAVAFCIVAIVQFVPDAGDRTRRWLDRVPQAWHTAAWLPAAVLAAGAFGITLYLNYSYGAHMPHVPDEVSYIFQAKVLASGHLSAPPPPPELADSFRLGSPPLTVTTGGHWASLYPFGHPMMLAIGARIGAIWLIPPLLGAGCVVLLFAIGRRLYNWRTGLLAALLFAGSPFFLMTASNFMSHNTATFYLLASILCLAFADKRPILFPALAGLFFGLLFNTRQLSGASLVVPYGLLLMTFPLARGRRITGIKQIAAFAAAAGVMLLLYFAYRWGTTGHPLASEQIQSGENAIGFGGAHSVAAGIEHEQTQLAYLVLVLNNWPVFIGLLFVLLPFVLGTRSKWDWFFLVAIAFMMGVYTLYFTDGLMHGPRYWYETTPLILLLAARGADLAAERVADAAAWLRRQATGVDLRPRGVAVAVVYVFVIGLAFLGWRSWMWGSGGDWQTDFVPNRAKELRGFNGINNTLVKQVDDQHLQNALVIVGECSGWQCYGNLDWRNSPFLDGNVIYARDLPDQNPKLLQAYPDRTVYYARYGPPAVLVPYDGAPPAANASPAAAATPRKGGDFPTPTPLVTPTASPLEAIARDETRKKDLAALAAALGRYAGDHGGYPVSPNVQSLCVYPADAGCALKDLLAPFPADPDPTAIYWYQSTGSQYVLYARLEGPAPPSGCPSPVPEHLSKVDHLYCVSAQASASAR